MAGAPGISFEILTDRTPTAGLPSIGLSEFWEAMSVGRSEIPLGPIDNTPNAGFRIFASSGTTGLPKYFAIDHRMMAERVYCQTLAYGLGSKVHMISYNMDMSVGIMHALRVLWLGGTVVMSIGRAGFDSIVRHRVTSLACSTGALVEILAMRGEAATPLPSLAMIEIGGSVLPEKLRIQAEERLCANAVSVFGAGEVGAVFSAPFRCIAQVPGAVGFVHAGVRAEVVDGSNTPLPAGEEGILRIRSAGSVAGYLGEPEITAQVFRDGWFYPGDIGVVQLDGLVILRGRASEVINAGGVKVSPIAIENVLHLWPDVIEAAVFGAPDADGIMRIRAAVVVKQGTDITALKAFCKSRLGSRAPVSIIALDELPRNASGKLVRDVLATHVISP